MKAIETIKKRRSVRSYMQKPIPRDILKIIINAGNCAPSGGNAQGWRFVVVENERFRNKLSELVLPRYKKWMENAPDGLKEMRKEIDANSEDPVYYNAPVIVFIIGSGMTADFDCPMVCENMMLAARSIDIGSCWVYFGQLVLDDQDIREELNLQEDEKVFGPILLGYPKSGFPDGPEKKGPNIKWVA